MERAKNRLDGRRSGTRISAGSTLTGRDHTGDRKGVSHQSLRLREKGVNVGAGLACLVAFPDDDNLPGARERGGHFGGECGQRLEVLLQRTNMVSDDAAHA